MVSALTRAAQQQVRFFGHIDWFIFFAALALSCLGLVTMRSFSAENAFFERQLIWIGLAVVVFFVASIPEYRFLRRTPVVVGLFVGISALLALLYALGTVVLGAQERFDIGLFFVQPADPAKFVLILVLAKYFARRHIEIKDIRHIIVSGAYALFLFVLIFFLPDFGSAIIIFSIWFGLVLIAGLSWRHLALLLVSGAIVGALLWNFGLQPYQKARIMTFLHPLADIQGAGYNAYQSTVAVGSGELTGKGIGYGTQSKLQFLPEFQTDFIFAAYAEEWGFVGVLLFLGLFAIIIVRIITAAARSGDNFDTLVFAGVAVYFMAQFVVHVGMNMGLMPITGATLPFMSYGGSHLLTEFAVLGVLMGLRRGTRPAAASRDSSEIIGVV